VYTDPIGRMKWDAREKELQRALPAINRLYCSPSARMRQIEGLSEGRISGSS
jgi:hypothetical protein